MNKMNADTFFRCALILVVSWYLFVCLGHFMYQRFLWNDEVAVFNSIEIFRPTEFFTKTLLDDQVFPRFYLLCVQTFAKQFHNSYLSLRFFSFVCMIGAFFIWLRVARHALRSPLEYLTFAMCWVASVPLIYYSAELKQYSMDVLVSGIFLLFLYAQENLRTSANSVRYMLILGLLPALVMFSYPAYFFLIFPLWNLCRALQTDRPQLKFLGIYLASVVVFAALSYQFDIRLRPIAAVTNGFNDYFISLQSFGDFFQTLGEGVNNLFSRWFVELPKIFRKIARFFMFFGFISLFVVFFRNIHKSQWKFYSVSTVALVVFFELILAGALQKYPFGVPRTVLFFCPLLLILTVQGIRAVKAFNPYVYYAVHGSFLVYLCAAALGILRIVLTQPLIAIPTIWSS